MLNHFAASVLAAAIVGAFVGVDVRGASEPVRPPIAAEKPAGQQAVPVKEVVLYTSGVGYFEHFGTVNGNGFTELHFKTKQINDILKSLILEDLDHGKVSSVTYGSQDPLSQTLKSFQVDLSSAPPLSDLLAQLRGASVTAALPSGPVSGEILSVEKKQKPVGDKQSVEVSVLNLLLPGGAIRPVEMDQVSEVHLDDAKLQQELVKALSAVAAARDQDSKPVAIRFTGQGERRVRIGYVVEAPVWKASYRLVLTEEAKNEQPGKAKEGGSKSDEPKPADGKAGDAGKDVGGNLQGWAIVENQTDSDWENVQLSLVSGRPISFIEDLYQPLYVGRPTVEPELYASLRPQRYAEALAAAPAAPPMERRAALQQNQQSLRRKAAFGSDKGAANGAMAGQDAVIDQQLFPGAMAGKPGNGPAGPLNATASVSALASGASIGEFFQYTVGDVSLPRQKSAMIPIVTDTVKASRLSIYNAGVLADHPLLGARLTNTTGKLLPQGPITVLDGGAYAGDASIGDLPTHQNRLLSYGIDQAMLVHSNDQTENSSLVTGKIVKGVLELTYKQIFTQKYVAQNKGKVERTLLIEHPKRQGWKLAEPASFMESTDALYRFEETVPADQSKTLAVQEELTSTQVFAILPMDPDQIDLYVKAGVIPDATKKALQQAAKLKGAVAVTQRQIQEQQQSINEITQEQNRIRDNMKAVSAASDYYKRLEKELDAQETQLQNLKSTVKDLRASQDRQQKELEDYLQNLSV